MQVIEYTSENKYINEYARLVKGIYAAYPWFAENRVQEACRAFNKKNPFLKFGSWKNFIIFDQGRPLAHISAILDTRLPPKVGLLGYFDAVNRMAYARKAFNQGVNFLTRNQKTIIRGPVDFTTWQGFRVAYPEKNPPFRLEPFTRGYYRNLFENYGFKTVQNNVSTIQKIDQTNFDSYKREYQNLKEQGFIFEAVNANNLPGVLLEIYNLVTKTFGESRLFVKISFAELVYNSRNSAEPYSLICIARDRSKKSVAFFLGAVDAIISRKKRLVFKTIGVLPEYQGQGIAQALFYLAYLKAKQKGVSELIFSTMRVDNQVIRKLTGSAPGIYRKYNVYELSV